MQTIYYRTSNFIRHEGNLVDLEAYRRKLAAAGGECAPSPCARREGTSAGEDRVRLRLAAPGESDCLQGRRSERRVRRLSSLLDLCASLSVVAFTAVAVIQFLQF